MFTHHNPKQTFVYTSQPKQTFAYTSQPKPLLNKPIHEFTNTKTKYSSQKIHQEHQDPQIIIRPAMMGKKMTYTNTQLQKLYESIYSQKVEFLSLFNSSNKQMNIVKRLADFVITELKLSFYQKESRIIIKKLLDSAELVKDQIIKIDSLIEVVVNAVGRVRAGLNAGQSAIKFIELFSIFKSEIILDSTYLISRWEKEIHKELENRESIYVEEEKCSHINCENIECQICIVDIDHKDLGKLGCGHMFHRECIYRFMKASILKNKLDISCPMEECGELISINDIQKFLDKELFEKFNQFSLNRYVEMNNKNTSWCPTPGCQAIFERAEDSDNYRCPSCMRHYCLDCMYQYHNGQSCEESRINNNYSWVDKKFDELVKGAKFKQCPSCKFWVEKSEGCSSMECRCGTNFCYECGNAQCVCWQVHIEVPVYYQPQILALVERNYYQPPQIRLHE